MVNDSMDDKMLLAISDNEGSLHGVRLVGVLQYVEEFRIAATYRGR